MIHCVCHFFLQNVVILTKNWLIAGGQDDLLLSAGGENRRVDWGEFVRPVSLAGTRHCAQITQIRLLQVSRF